MHSEPGIDDLPDLRTAEAGGFVGHLDAVDFGLSVRGGGAGGAAGERLDLRILRQANTGSGDRQLYAMGISLAIV